MIIKKVAAFLTAAAGRAAWLHGDLSGAPARPDCRRRDGLCKNAACCRSLVAAAADRRVQKGISGRSARHTGTGGRYAV